MDQKLIEQVSTRSSFGIDNNLKYLDFEGTIPNRLNMLREIANSLPEGKRKASMNEIINYFHAAFTEILKDWHGLQEGSKLRNIVDDAVGSLMFKEKEIAILTEIIKNRANDNRRGGTN